MLFRSNLCAILPGVDPSAVALLAMAAYLSGVTQAPLTATVITMDLTDNQQMVLPIMATCLLARAASSLLSRKPVYRALADKLIEGYELERARRAAEEAGDDDAFRDAAIVEDPATPLLPPESSSPTNPTDHRPS